MSAPPFDRRDAGCDRASHTGRGMHNALGYQLRQVSKQIRELQKQALAQNTRSDEAETPKNGEEHGMPRKS